MMNANATKILAAAHITISMTATGLVWLYDSRTNAYLGDVQLPDWDLLGCGGNARLVNGDEAVIIKERARR